MFKKCLVAGVCLLFIATTILAYPRYLPAPEIDGPTGVVRMPSADVIPYKNFNVGMDYGTTVTSNGSATGEAAIFYKMNLGTFHGVELGIVGGTEKNSSKLREGVFVNMKLSLSTGDEPDPLLLALGVENLFSYTQTDVYMVATKYFQQGPKLSFGFMADFPDNKFRPMGIAGIDIGLGDTVFLLSDLQAGETIFQLNSGVKIYLTPTFSLNITGLNVLDGEQAKDPRTALIGFSWANPF